MAFSGSDSPENNNNLNSYENYSLNSGIDKFPDEIHDESGSFPGHCDYYEDNQSIDEYLGENTNRLSVLVYTQKVDIDSAQKQKIIVLLTDTYKKQDLKMLEYLGFTMIYLIFQ